VPTAIVIPIPAAYGLRPVFGSEHRRV